MTDRFHNGDPSNDTSVGRTQDGGVLRGFSGGDIKGITQKIDSGYFSALGVDAIWTTPLIENIHGAVEDEYGKTYAYHGYWPKDWTAVDPNFGTENDLRELIETAHGKGIRVLADVIINHTGPATSNDVAWPEDWVRGGPPCEWDSYEHIADCTIVETLPDIVTERNDEVELPQFLVEKWRKEGRLEQEVTELDEFFARTEYPRAPKYYIIKWLTDWVRDYGIDGFRVDTAKHVDAAVWQELRIEAEKALAEWRRDNPHKKIDDRPFFMVGEVMNWGMQGFENASTDGRAFDYGDRQVDFYSHGFDALINMGFPTHAAWPYERLFGKYSQALNGGPLNGFGTLNYVTSHDDQNPFDADRSRAWESATKLMLAPGAVQVSYGDEVARDMTGEGSTGDAWLRTEMNWVTAKTDDAKTLLAHWRKLGKYRQAHRAVGAGVHRRLQEAPYLFSRVLDEGDIDDTVLIGLDLPTGKKKIFVHGVFANGTKLTDYYSDQVVVVKNGYVNLDSTYPIMLLGE